MFADKAWCDYCHKPYVREQSSLLKHLQRHHKEQLSKPCGQSDSPFSLTRNEKQTTLKAKKAQLEQYFSTNVPPLTKDEHDNAIQLLARAWCDNLLPSLLADSLSFNKFIACILRGSFQMPGRTKMTEMVDELHATMMVKLKALLQQSTSVSLTTDAAKMPTRDSYVAVTGHWISSEWELLSAVLGVSIGLPMNENPPANEDDAPNEPNVKHRRFDDCDFLDEDEPDEQETSEVATGGDGLHRAVQGEFDACCLFLRPDSWMLIPLLTL